MKTKVKNLLKNKLSSLPRRINVGYIGKKIWGSFGCPIFFVYFCSAIGVDERLNRESGESPGQFPLL